MAGLNTHESLRTPSLVFHSTPSICFTHVLEDQLSSKQKDEKTEETAFFGEHAYYFPQKNVVAEGTGYTGNDKKGICSKERVSNSLG